MSIDDDIKIEYENYKNGLNPNNGGEWEHTFNFRPIPYFSENKKLKEEFKEKNV